MTVTVRTDFAGGNGQLVGVEDCGARPTVRFAAEPRNCPLALWFHFRLTGLDGRGARCVLANPEQTLGGADWSGNRLVCRAVGGEWARTGPPERLDAPAGRVEWVWDLDVEGDAAELAFCYPYQPADLDRTLAELGEAFRSAPIGLTPHGRQIPRLTSAAEPDAHRPAVYLTARHHAGETPGSWVLDGLLCRVARTPRLLEGVTWWAVPFVDLDDVVEGSYGKDPHPRDCNRAYGPGAPTRPEAAAIAADVRRLRQAADLRFFADLHAPSHGEQVSYVPIRGWMTGAPVNPVAEEFAEVLHAATPDDIRSPIAHKLPPPSDNPFVGLSSTRWATEQLGLDAACIETSYQGNGRRCYLVDDYRRLGAALADALAAWLGRPHSRGGRHAAHHG